MPDQPTIFSLHYKGSRFRNARLPVEVLSDLPAFRDLLVSYAKDEWRRRHAERERVPKGFDKSLAFDLISIENGSAIPQLEWNRDSAQANLPGFADEIEEIIEAAYGDVVALIAGQSGRVSALSSEKVRALNRFGAGLRDNEKIEIPDRSTGKVVSLDAFRRKQLITGARETYQTRFEGIGQLIGTHIKSGDEGVVTIRTTEHGDIIIPVDPLQIKEEFDGSLEQDVQFELLVELDSQDHFRRVADVFDIAVVDNELSAALAKCRERLDEIRALDAGWHDGSGLQITDSALKAARLFLVKRTNFCAVFRIFPTEAGGILIDFENGGWDYSIEFSAAGRVEIYGIEIDGSGELEPEEFDFVNEKFLSAFDIRMSANG
ncbi:MAG: hypothetical protein B7Z80_19660 [Rhodospirillales bacterium 20-64-7]|nr:MAG: hypothetical protein B7Z80_19660 [Rhodospirillales bacterium 20-64-7]